MGYRLTRRKKLGERRRTLKKIAGGDKPLTYNDYNIIRSISKKITNKGISHFQKVFNKKDATNVYIRAKFSNDKKVIDLLDKSHIKYEDKYLMHSFRDILPELILNPGKLLAISKQTSKITSQWYNENNVNQQMADYKNVIFTTFFYKDSKIMPNSSSIYLLLDVDLLKDSEECAPNSTYICNRWNFAKHNDNCIPYTGNLNEWIDFVKYVPKEYSEEDRVDIMEEFEIEENEVNEFIEMEERMNGIRMPFGTPDNEVTIKYSKDISGKCVKSEISLKKYLKAIVILEDEDENEYDIKGLQKKYPEYNWIII